jgi:hypothetical protein
VDSLKPYALVKVSFAAILVLGLVTPVAAFHFEFHFFESDQLVYEVGETINMVAELIADFSASGWCYVSFAVVTDIGPVFSDDYFILPSTSVRFLRSSYTILPEHTSPGENGTQAFVIFNIEVFDEYSQGTSRTIPINITRGNLVATPESSLSLDYGQNNSLAFSMTSQHNNSIVYSNEPLHVEISNRDFIPILQQNTSTDNQGFIFLDWNTSMVSPDDYNITLSANGTSDFMPFSQSFTLTVNPANSSLNVIMAPNSVIGQSPDGSEFETIDIAVQHLGLDDILLNDSTIIWEADFANGNLTFIGSGVYSVDIPFQVEPGEEHINITATNPHFQNAIIVIPIQVVHRNISATILTLQNMTSGSQFDTLITISDLITGTMTQDIPMSVSVFVENTLLGTVYGTSNMTGSFNFTTFIPAAIWGFGNITIYTNRSSCYSAYTYSEPIYVYFVEQNMTADFFNCTAFYGENLELKIIVLDNTNQSIEMINILSFVDGSSVPFSTQISSQTLSIPLPFWINPGNHSFTLNLSKEGYGNTSFTFNVIVWMRTTITIIVNQESSQAPEIIPIISSGSIINPPPILFNGTTSTKSPTALETSPISCPKLSSGTSNLSTVCANERTSAYGNGQRVLSLRDLTSILPELYAITSSTDLEVQPNETIPHLAF